jgi:hypothetical protein
MKVTTLSSIHGGTTRLHKGYFFAPILMLPLLSFGSRKICAQAEAPRFESGVQFSILRHNGSAYTFAFLDPQLGPERTDVGVGERVGYNVTRYISLEYESNFFPRDLPSSRSRTQEMFGVKAGNRFEKVGVFGKVRPGFMYFSKGYLPPFAETFPGKAVFALDLGGVIEVYHSHRFFSRFDFGDTLIRATDHVSTGGPFRTVSAIKSNFQFSAGVGVRF